MIKLLMYARGYACRSAVMYAVPILFGPRFAKWRIAPVGGWSKAGARFEDADEG
jgi:hypothetical protein